MRHRLFVKLTIKDCTLQMPHGEPRRLRCLKSTHMIRLSEFMAGATDKLLKWYGSGRHISLHERHLYGYSLPFVAFSYGYTLSVSAFSFQSNILFVRVVFG